MLGGRIITIHEKTKIGDQVNLLSIFLWIGLVGIKTLKGFYSINSDHINSYKIILVLMSYN